MCYTGQTSNRVNQSMEMITKKSSQTQKAGEILAEETLKTRPGNKAFLLGLEGDLGGGKTTFLQGFARGLGIKEKTLSPTFVILKKFTIPHREAFSFLRRKRDLKFKTFYHIDCYRIQKPKEILGLGLKEIISNPRNIVAIEWADKIKKFLPRDTLILKFQFVNKDSRKIWLTKRKS